MPRLSVSGLSILTAHAEDLESTFGLLSPNRLGLDLAWIAFVYLSIQLVSLPFAAASKDRFIGVLDGMASLLPLGISLVVIFGKSEVLVTPERWRDPKQRWHRAAVEARRWSRYKATVAAAAWVGSWAAGRCRHGPG